MQPRKYRKPEGPWNMSRRRMQPIEMKTEVRPFPVKEKAQLYAKELQTAFEVIKRKKTQAWTIPQTTAEVRRIDKIYHQLWEEIKRRNPNLQLWEENKIAKTLSPIYFEEVKRIIPDAREFEQYGDQILLGDFWGRYEGPIRALNAKLQKIGVKKLGEKETKEERKTMKEVAKTMGVLISEFTASTND